MKLPEVQNPEKFTGLYIFDFGDQVAIGYTADEIAVLLESEQYRDGKIFRIHRALPDGSMELQGIPPERFQQEDGLFFYRYQPEDARQDMEDLLRLADHTPPPCRMKVHRARLETSEATTFVTALLFPAEYSQEVGQWLDQGGFVGGELVEGGPSQVTHYYEVQPEILERRQFWAADSGSRPAEEVLATTHLALQRVPA